MSCVAQVPLWSTMGKMCPRLQFHIFFGSALPLACQGLRKLVGHVAARLTGRLLVLVFAPLPPGLFPLLPAAVPRAAVGSPGRGAQKREPQDGACHAFPGPYEQTRDTPEAEPGCPSW